VKSPTQYDQQFFARITREAFHVGPIFTPGDAGVFSVRKGTMIRFLFDAWTTIHAIATRVERMAGTLREKAAKRSTALNLALLNEERRHG
jgi:hypothetical protein